MTDFNSPIDVEEAIRECSNRIAKGVGVVAARLREYRMAERTHETAFNKAYFAAEGSVEDRKRHAYLETVESKEVLDASEVGYQHARSHARALEGELSALQTISAGLRKQFETAGRGEGA